MAVESRTKKVVFRLNLNNGLDESGAIKTVSVSLGGMSATSYDDAKAYAVGTALENCLSKSVYGFQKAETSQVMDM